MIINLTAKRKSRGLAPELDSLQWGLFPHCGLSGLWVCIQYLSHYTKVTLLGDVKDVELFFAL